MGHQLAHLHSYLIDTKVTAQLVAVRVWKLYYITACPLTPKSDYHMCGTLLRAHVLCASLLVRFLDQPDGAFKVGFE